MPPLPDDPLPPTAALDGPLEGWVPPPGERGAPSAETGVAGGIPQRLALPARYRDLGLLGAGGMGEVRAVWDRRLRRRLAMKILRLDAAGHAEARARFTAEARVTAGLQHPGIVAVHDEGVLPDGRPWLTMREVRGATFAEVLARPVAGSPMAALRGHVEVLARVCAAVGHAHALGVVHRDLKPQNVMVGEHGDVLVLDWGLARALGDAEPDRPADEPALDDGADPTATDGGRLFGSPGYVPPERLAGATAPDPRADVYALGVMLHEILVGRRASAPLEKAAIVSAAAAAGREAPPDLAALCARALAPRPEARLPDARALGEGLERWLAALRHLGEAEARLAQAAALAPRIEGARAEAAGFRAEAEARLAAVPPHAPEVDKRPAWDLEDAAAEAERRVLTAELEWARALGSALELVPELGPAHAALARHFREACDAASARGREEEVIRLEALVRAHDRGEHAAWLRGDAALTLVTDAADAEVHVFRYVRDGRRLVLRPHGAPLAAPLHAHVLPHGSYLLELRAVGRAPLRYPVLLARGGHWDGRAPGEAAPRAVRLWPDGALDPDEVVVPAGWFAAGGDPDAPEGLPARRVWLDDFALARHPVTVRAYAAFLDALVADGRAEEADRWTPREQGQGEADAPLLVRGADGRFGPRPDGQAWALDWPVTMVSWHAACAYAAWRGALTGRPYRLPYELEWEKAARGVDGRRFPWGDHADPTWARMIDSLPDRTSRAPVDAHPVDESPHGVRGLGGNVRDWCLDRYQRGGAPILDGRPAWPPAEGEGHRLIRGGCWASAARMCRAAARFAALPEVRMSVVGFRLARSLPGGGATG